MASAFHRMNSVRQSKGRPIPAGSSTTPSRESSSSGKTNAWQETPTTTPRLSSGEASGDRLLGQVTTKLARHSNLCPCSERSAN